MDRRKFLKDGCSACVGIASGSLIISLLESCSPLPVFKTLSENREIKVPISQFIENKYLIIKATDVNYDVALIKNENENYKSIVMQCTHAENPVRYNGKEFRCNLHGSLFNSNGEVKTGPAEKPLIHLQTEIKNDYIIIKLI
jgi:Rieske Fe-S protein